MPGHRKTTVAPRSRTALLSCTIACCAVANGGDLKHPDWHPDRDVLIAEGSCNGGIGLYLVDAASGEVRLLFDSDDIDGYPRWFPDGAHVAFHRIDSNGAARIFVAELSPAGKIRDVRPVTPGPFDIEPAPSPDGTKIAFSLAGANGQDVAIVDLEDGGLISWQTPAAENLPSWHPNGRSILFHARDSEETHLYTRLLATGETRQITHSGSPNLVGHFDGDGMRIVFSSERDGDREIYVRALRSQEEARITKRAGRDGYPRFSPDGSRIAYHWSAGSGQTSLRILDVESGESHDFSCTSR